MTYASDRDRIVCEFYVKGMPIQEIKEKTRTTNIYHILKTYQIPLRTVVRQKTKSDIATMVCKEFDSGEKIEAIVDKVSIPSREVITILKEHREKELMEYIEDRKKREEIKRIYLKKKKEAELRIKKIDEEKQLLQKQLEQQRKQIEDDERDRKLKALKEKDLSHLGGFLSRQAEKAEIKSKINNIEFPERLGIHSPLESLLLGNGAEKVKNEIFLHKDIAHDYLSGVKIQEILKKHKISLEYFVNLIETSGEEPGYFPDRPPLNV